MRGRVRAWGIGTILLGMVVMLSGCAIKFSERSPWDIQQIQVLSDQLEQFRTLAQLKSEEADRLRAGKALFESELSDENVSIGFDERGLVVRVLDRVLFDSGKAELRHDAHDVLDTVARVLNEQLPDQPVGIEGHTDNEPIRHSGWKDNWELSMARARSVLTYLVQERGVNPGRVSASGYGEYRPIASNDTAAGRRLNRRVEIVVLPHGASPALGPASAAEAASEATEATTHYDK